MRVRCTEVVVLTLGLSLFPVSARAETDCAKVLVPKKSSFQSSVYKWMSLLNAINMGQQSQSDTSVGFGYAGFDLSYSDAQAAASFYQQRTRYALAESDTLSIVSTELSPEVARSFVECVKGSKQDITITAPSGSERQEAFQIKVLWTPTYSVRILEGTTDRVVTLNVTNGKNITSAQKTISPTGSATFNLTRDSLDKPISISAAIDGRDSDFFTFPAKPDFDLSMQTIRADYGPIRRSGHYGNSEASAQFCLPSPSNAQFLPTTAKAFVTGNGQEWDVRSKISLVDKTPLSVCAIVKSAGVTCNEDKCYHDTTGHLSAVQVTTSPIEK